MGRLMEEGKERIKNSIPKQAKHLSGVLREAGYDAYLVGGCVRDGIIGTEPNDFDFVTNANVEQITKTLDKNGITYDDQYDFLSYIIANVDGMDIDICKYHGDSIEEDLRHRDITINAIAYDMEENNFIDPLGGLKDIENGIIRIINGEALTDSPQVILKAMRFSLQYNFKIDDTSYAAMQEHVPDLRNIRTSQVEKIVRKTLKHCRKTFTGKEK